MRLLIVIDSLILAGAEALTKDLVLCFRRRGVEVTVGVLKPLDSPFEQELRAVGVPFLPDEDVGIYSPRHVFRLAKHVPQFDVVHTLLFPAQLFVVLAARLSRSEVPIVLSEQGTSNRRRHAFFRPFDAWMYRHYAAIPCASEAIARALIQFLPALALKISVIPNAIDVERFASATPARKRDLIGRDDVLLAIFTARLEPDKDHALILRALAEVPGLHIAFLGDGILRPRLQQIACNLDIAERVHFLGRRGNVPELLKAADVYVHCSHFEGFGIAALEAMAVGLPVIATDIPGLAQVVGDAGILVPPGQPDALAQALQLVLESPGLRAQLSRAGVERARNFGIESTADQYLNLYRSILAGRDETAVKAKRALSLRS